MDQLRAIKYFVKVAETGSFTQAAKHFSVPASSLSRRVAGLEQSLGATLLKRSTRVVKLTEIGRKYYCQVAEILRQLELSCETVRSYQTEPTGVLRISAMVGFGEQILLPLLDEFSQLYPQVVLDIQLSDELSTIGRDDVDLLIRGGYAPNERVIAIELMDNAFIAAAAPDYLSAMGVPTSALQLREHKGLYFRTPTGPTPWLCEIAGQWHDVSAPPVAMGNSGTWLLAKAVKGEGIIMLPRWVLRPYLQRGELTELAISSSLSISQNSHLAIFLLYQKQRYHVPKIKAAVDFLVARIKGQY